MANPIAYRMLRLKYLRDPFVQTPHFIDEEAGSREREGHFRVTYRRFKRN